jgi:excisionase family DNA binding protein
LTKNDGLAARPIDQNRWLALGEASRTLGVTPNTLRRWADRGQIASFTTPGGHRRFPFAAVQALVPAGRTRRPALASIGESSDRMARAYRRARPLARTHEQAAWLARLNESERTRFRERGMRLVGELLALLDAERKQGPLLLARAERQASEYGAEAARLGASLGDTVEGFLRFRKPFVDELAGLARRRRLDTREATALLADADSALDRILVALMTGHAAGGREA